MNIVVLGAGESGVGAAILAKQKGYTVFVSDFGKIKTAYQAELNQQDIPYEEGQHDKPRIKQADLVIKSPGIPDNIPLVIELKELGIPVISEIEFAYAFAKGKIIGITGTNGKTTTTRLTYHLLKAGGLDVAIGGNVGVSFARNLSKGPSDFHVLELSSFQLDGIKEFRPDIAMLLNISPDHLDRYEYKLDLYIESKFRITKNQTAANELLYFEEDKNIVTKLNELDIKARQRAINSKYFVEGHLVIGDLNFNLDNTALKGKHNALNAAFAIQTALMLGLSPEIIQQALESFENDPHRMELVANIDGIQYINDSKATNVEAVYYALEAMDRPIIWMAGGQDKGNDYTALLPVVKARVKKLICLGLDNEKLKATFENLIQEPIEEARSISEALSLAQASAKAGEVVLLSPACASFDLFKNYIDRGDQFRAAVLKINN
ncbi:MAG: UDP-N-acetylmuramoyl-L-alanine--D-glutamate ligase [Saprospiraceae bacterium]